MAENVSLIAHLYEAIKAEVKSGVFPPGQRISATGLSKRFSTSVIPIRETLYRLVGERLIETQYHNGFHAPRIGEVYLRDLYQFQLFLLLSALEYHTMHHLKWAGTPDISAAEPSVATIEMLFSHLADNVGRSELRWFLNNTIDRLHAVGLMKDEVVEDWASECGRLLGQWQHGDVPSFKEALLSYHRRRIELVPALVKRINQPRTAN